MNEEDRKTFKISFKDQRRIINKEITLLDLVIEKEEEIERLNKVLIYLEKYFSEREYYEFAQLVRETKKANIEWLEGAVKDYE